MIGNAAMVYAPQNTVIIISENSFAVPRAHSIVEACGGRVVATMSLTDSATGLVADFVPDTILLDLCEIGGALFDQSLDHINAIATAGNASLIVSIPPKLIDVVSARITTSNATILCEPTTAEQVAALSLAWAKQTAHVHDRGQDFDAVRLQHLADEVGRIAKMLTSLSDGTPLSGGTSVIKDAVLQYNFEPAVTRVPELTASEIRAFIKMRRLRERHFEADIFSDPAWDMMLDLMAARAEHTRVSVSSLCIASSVPPTTALRWIKTLTEQGYFVRVADPTDGRRVFVQLSDKTAIKIAQYFAEAKKLGGPLMGSN